MTAPVKSTNNVPGNVALVILAGGASRRLHGKQKALIDVGGQTILDMQLNELGNLFDAVYISIKNDGQERLLREACASLPRSVVFVQDLAEFPGNARDNAAIFGMYSVFSAIDAEYAFIISCDMPFVQQAVARVLASYLEENPDAIVPLWDNGYMEPTLAIYKVETARDVMKSLLAEGTYQLIEVFKLMDSVIYVPIADIKDVDPDLACLINVNTETDLDKVREIVANKG